MSLAKTLALTSLKLYVSTAKDAKEEEKEERGTSERPKESTGKLKQRGENRQITNELLVQLLEEAVSQGEGEP